MSKLTERELQSLRNLGNEAEQAAERIEHLERVLVQAREAMNSVQEFMGADFDDLPMAKESRAALAAIDEALKDKT